MTENKQIQPGDWFSNENGNQVTVMAVSEGWCMVKEEDKEVPYVLPEEFVLATFDCLPPKPARPLNSYEKRELENLKKFGEYMQELKKRNR